MVEYVSHRLVKMKKNVLSIFINTNTMPRKQELSTKLVDKLDLHVQETLEN